jgi:FtsP/CotA-like multicopper oxidase with cupredoxin domain
MITTRLVLAGLGGIVALGALFVRPGTSVAAGAGDEFPQPREVRSVGGVLYDTLEAAPGTINVGGKEIPGALLYNGRYPATTWRVKPGDRLRLLVTNKMREGTNLHFHGMHVDPTGHADNVLADIGPGEARGYTVNIPTDHTSGLNWYHPHLHGTTSPQVHGGLAGLIVVEGELDQLPEVKGLTERLMAYEFLTFDGAGRLAAARNPKSSLQLVNGVQTPTMRARPNETQFFRFGNTSSTGWVKLSVEGHKMRVLAEDGDPYTTADDVDFFILPPGKRVEFLVQFSGPGRYAIRNEGYTWGGTTPSAALARVVVEGEPVTPRPLPTQVSDRLERSSILTATPDRTRTFTFDQDTKASPAKFMIDNRTFDHHRVDVTVKLNELEEWEIVNTTDDEHPFHIHVNDFIVTKVNGQPTANPHFQDTALIPAHGRITIRQRFEDFTGTFVMHCHILGHEDGGMMATVEVVR